MLALSCLPGCPARLKSPDTAVLIPVCCFAVTLEEVKRLRHLLAERRPFTLRLRRRRDGRRWCIIGCRAAGWTPSGLRTVPSSMLPEAWTLCWTGVGLSWPVQPLCGLPAAQSQGAQLGCGIAAAL